MITIEKTKELCKATRLYDYEQLEVIRRYIFDVKGFDIGNIDRPRSPHQLQLMTIAFETACEYYLGNGISKA